MKTTTLSIEEWQKIVNQYQIFDGTIDQFLPTKAYHKISIILL